MKTKQASQLALTCHDQVLPVSCSVDTSQVTRLAIFYTASLPAFLTAMHHGLRLCMPDCRLALAIRACAYVNRSTYAHVVFPMLHAWDLLCADQIAEGFGTVAVLCLCMYLSAG